MQAHTIESTQGSRQWLTRLELYRLLPTQRVSAMVDTILDHSAVDLGSTRPHALRGLTQRREGRLREGRLREGRLRGGS